MEETAQAGSAEAKAEDRCAYAFCLRAAVGCAGFDFSCLGLLDLNAQSRLCSGHLDSILHRVSKLALRESRKVGSGSGRRLWFFRRSLLDSPARSDSEGVSNALSQVQSALESASGRATLRSGFERALYEAKARRWNAQRTAEWAEIVAFYGGLCAYCGGAAWECVSLLVPARDGGDESSWNVVPACNSCSRELGLRMPIRFHRLLVVQENPGNGETATRQSAVAAA